MKHRVVGRDQTARAGAGRATGSLATYPDSPWAKKLGAAGASEPGASGALAPEGWRTAAPRIVYGRLLTPSTCRFAHGRRGHRVSLANPPPAPWQPLPSRRYERRRPEKTPLHKIVSENLESWLAWRERRAARAGLR